MIEMNVSVRFDSNLQIIWYQQLTKNCFVHRHNSLMIAKSDNFTKSHSLTCTNHDKLLVNQINEILPNSGSVLFPVLVLYRLYQYFIIREAFIKKKVL